MCGMIKNDRIYQVLLKYNFDLFRGDKNIAEYMREYCNQFYCDICDAVKGDNSFLGEDSKEKMQLFHIKKTLRNRVGAYRYSAVGSPCLYLASDRELAWFECGMP